MCCPEKLPVKIVYPDEQLDEEEDSGEETKHEDKYISLPELEFRVQKQFFYDYNNNNNLCGYYNSTCLPIEKCGKKGTGKEAKSVAGNHWLRLSPSVTLLRGQVWSSLRCQ